MYKCHACGKQFRGGIRVNYDLFWQEYLHNKQTYNEISERYGVSVSTVKRKIASVQEEWQPIIPQKAGFLLLDTTYFGRNWGILVAMDAETSSVLYRKYVYHECIKDYVECVQYIVNQGFIVKGMVVDGMRGLFKTFSQYQVQMCQYHQCAIIRRYLTQNPRLEAGKELSLLMKKLTTSTKLEFTTQFKNWEIKWNDFLNERSKNPETGKSYYVHRKLRSAKRSIKSNIPYLFVYQEEGNEGLPNTNNKLEGKFTDLKKNLNNHSGMSKKNRKRFIDGFFKA
ncbi:MAG: hypothetical protein WBI36_04630 [Erysipelotrichaceae bacterium]